MAITLNADNGGGEIFSPFNVSLNIGTLSNGILVAVANVEGSSGTTIDSVIFDPGGGDEQAFDFVVEAALTPGFVNRSAIYVLREADLPPSGTFDIQFNGTLGTSPGFTGHVYSWNGAEQVIPAGSQISSSTPTSTTTVTVTPTTATDDSLSIVGASSSSNTSYTPPSSYNEGQDLRPASSSMTGFAGDFIEPTAALLSLVMTTAINSSRLPGVGACWGEAGGAPATVIPIFVDSYRRRWA